MHALLVDLAGFFDAVRRFNEGICISDSAKKGGNRGTVREMGYLLAGEGEILLLGSFLRGHVQSGGRKKGWSLEIFYSKAITHFSKNLFSF